MDNVRCGEVESVEKGWEKFRDKVMECTNDACGIHHSCIPMVTLWRA